MSSLLEVEDLTVRYGGVVAVEDVSFHVDRGEFVALLGSNGAGKSTCLNAIMGGVKPASGDIHYNGEVITELSPRKRVERGLSISPENRELFPDMTVEENLNLGGYTIRDEGRLTEFRREVYDLFPVLADRRDQTAKTLSGGQQQMVAIGRSLMSDPEILLLDEPSLGLAPNLVTETGEFIHQLQTERDVTILIVEQNIEIPFDYSNRVYLLKNGSVVSENNTEDLKDSDAVRESYMGI